MRSLAVIAALFLVQTACGGDDPSTITDMDAGQDTESGDVIDQPDTDDTDTDEPDTIEPDIDEPDADVIEDTDEPDADVIEDTDEPDADVTEDTDEPDADVIEDTTPDADVVEPPTFEGYCPELVNPDAETGNISGWTTGYGEFVAQEETGIFSGNYPAAHQGTYYFRAGGEGSSGIYQDVDVSADAEAIDAGLVWAELTAFVRDFDSDDEASLRIEALSADGTELLTHLTGPWAHTSWRERGVGAHLPEGTRTVRVHLSGKRNAGFSNDAYFDVVSLCLTGEAPEADIGELVAPPYLMWATETEVSVRFESANAFPATIYYGPTEALGMEMTEASATRMHELRLTGLTPGSLNYYQIAWNDRVLPIWDFATALPADDDSPFNFVFFADNQDGPEHFVWIADQMAAEDPAFVLSAGDNVQNGKADEYRSQMWQPLFGLGNHAALLTSGGNHETYSSLIFTSDTSRALWLDQVSQPNDEHCFGWRWGQLFALFLDSESDHDAGSAQYACAESYLETDMAQTARYRIVVMHRPALTQFWDPVAIFPSSVSFDLGGMDAPDVRADLAPLFEAHGVQLVFNGHNHLYAYYEHYPESILWVTAGGAGGGLESGTEDTRVADWSEYVDTTIVGHHHYLRVDVSTDEMVIEMVNEDDEVMHTFSVVP